MSKNTEFDSIKLVQTVYVYDSNQNSSYAYIHIIGMELLVYGNVNVGRGCNYV